MTTLQITEEAPVYVTLHNPQARLLAARYFEP